DGEVPVELTSFTATAKNNSVVLNWKTSTEKNNQGFEVQKKNGNVFFTIGFVEGKGTTTEPQQYSYIDKNLENGVYEYRLKQIDFDGSFQYSDVVNSEVNSVMEFRLQQNYPNPFNPSTKIRFSVPEKNFVNLSVFNLMGENVIEIVNEVKDSGEYEVSFNGSDLPSGIYIAKISSGEFNKTIKMSLLK
ncbi:MAG: T9SS type A sorting domain-containing protein, partial [Ignavibacteriaceae bacterium]